MAINGEAQAGVYPFLFSVSTRMLLLRQDASASQSGILELEWILLLKEVPPDNF